MVIDDAGPDLVHAEEVLTCGSLRGEGEFELCICMSVYKNFDSSSS
jgi:hypothetical protein